VCKYNCCQALDPNSDFPEKPVGSKEQQDATRDYLGPAASGQDMKVKPLTAAPPHLQADIECVRTGQPKPPAPCMQQYSEGGPVVVWPDHAHQIPDITH